MRLTRRSLPNSQNHNCSTAFPCAGARPSIACSGFLRFKIKSQEHTESPIVFPGENGERQYRSPQSAPQRVFSVFRRRRGCGQYQRRPVSDGFMRAFAALQLYLHAAFFSLSRGSSAYTRTTTRPPCGCARTISRPLIREHGKPGAYCGAVSAATRIEKSKASRIREALLLSISLFCSHSFCRTARSYRCSRCRSSRPFSWRGTRRATR